MQIKAKYELVMFDFDGTLADSFSIFVNAVNGAAGKYQFKPIEKTEEDHLRHHSAREMIKLLNVPKWKLPFVARYMRKTMTSSLRRIKLFDGVDNLLKCLKQKGVEIAIVSTSSYQSVVDILGKESAALVDYFECSASLFGKTKKIIKVLKQSSVDKRQCLLVGDEIRDIDAARKVSVPVGVVSWGYTHMEALKKYQPDECFCDFEDMIKVLSNT